MPFWILAAICVIAILRERRAVWVGIILAGVLPILVFFNLYAVQAYYLAAVTPAAAAVIGYSLDGLVRRLRTVPLRAVTVTLIIVWLGATLYTQRDFVASSYTMPTPDPANILAQAREIDAGTKPGDLIVFDGLQWSPAVPYYRPAPRGDARADHRHAPPAELLARAGIYATCTRELPICTCSRPTRSLCSSGGPGSAR